MNTKQTFIPSFSTPRKGSFRAYLTNQLKQVTLSDAISTGIVLGMIGASWTALLMLGPIVSLVAIGSCVVGGFIVGVICTKIFGW